MLRLCFWCPFIAFLLARFPQLEWLSFGSIFNIRANRPPQELNLVVLKDFFVDRIKHQVNLTHFFPLRHFYTPWKHQGVFYCFRAGGGYSNLTLERKGVIVTPVCLMLMWTSCEDISDCLNVIFKALLYMKFVQFYYSPDQVKCHHPLKAQIKLPIVLSNE